MLNFHSIPRVYLACGKTDFRLSIDELANKVQLDLLADPFSSSLFVFCNKRRDKIKILYWDTNGFWLFYKRLEQDRFCWPINEEQVKLIRGRELTWLLDGLDFKQPRAHKEFHAKYIL